MSRPGRVDTRPTGTFLLKNRATPAGAIEQFSTYIGTVSRRGRESPIRITEAHTERCTCSPRQILNHSRSLSSKLRNQWGSTVFRIRMDT